MAAKSDLIIRLLPASNRSEDAECITRRIAKRTPFASYLVIFVDSYLPYL